MRVLITGGCGFIGSHLVDILMGKGLEVSVFDNLSTGRLQYLKPRLESPKFLFVKGDLTEPHDLVRLNIKNYDVIFHFAANADVRVSIRNPNVHFQQSVLATYKLLELIRKKAAHPVIVFASTSAVYGDAKQIPTPEDYSPLKPISVYGATKLACEALLSAYALTYGFRVIIYRLANIAGSRSSHGIIYDFINKLRANSQELKILGDGRQRKSYLYVDDCIQVILIGLEKTYALVETYNVGSEDQIDVKSIAHIVAQEMGLRSARFRYTGGVAGDRVWRLLGYMS